ncbi:MAG: recombination mediator RecR [bacterium]|nr:recombination mediator RecR [bacterium]
MYPKTIQKLIGFFSKFPTVGPRTAARFVFYLLKLKGEEVEELTSSISKLKENIKLCNLCFLPFEPSTDSNQEVGLCPICQDKTRDKSLLCVVEKEPDLESLEKTKKYKGLYFILGGTVSALKKENIKQLRGEGFLKRAKDPEIKEIIVATNPTTEGEATALYIERLLKPLNKKITRLGRGLPVGAELEYADEETLSSALEGRK